MKRLTHYWAHDFDWRKAETELNKLPQFITQIQLESFGEYDVHFVHQQSSVKHAIPFLFIHGWPGGFFEVTKLLPYLADNGDHPAFHVVAPSLVDFGFSSASRTEGFGVGQHAEICHNLMLSLGYNEYVIQASDIGSLTARLLTLTHSPTHCKALHITTALPSEPTPTTHPALHATLQSTPPTATDLANLARATAFFATGLGYYRLASTKPQTLGYALADSPVGLLAWIYEKLQEWSDPRYGWTEEEICTWVSVYWFSTPTPSASSNFFYATEHRKPEGAFAASQVYIPVPLGVARFAHDTVLLPRLWNHTLGPVVYESEYEVGGHFAAWERPDAIARDLRAMFGRGGVVFGCVAERCGYGEQE